MDAELFKGEVILEGGFRLYNMGLKFVAVVLSPTYGGSASASVSEGSNVIVTCLFLGVYT